jgi:hypothetical protein
MPCGTQTQPEHNPGITVDQDAIGLSVPATASSHQFFFVILFQAGSQKEAFTYPDEDVPVILSRIHQKTIISYYFLKFAEL